MFIMEQLCLMFIIEQICLMFIMEQIRIISDEAVHVFMTIGCYYFMTSRTTNGDKHERT